MKHTKILLMSLAILALAACSPGEITQEELLGTWRVVQVSSYLQFNADGTYRIAVNVNDLEGSTVEQGDYTLEGSLFTFISNVNSRNCEEGERGMYELERSESDTGDIRMIHQEDECRNRALPVATLRRVP